LGKLSHYKSTVKSTGRHHVPLIIATITALFVISSMAQLSLYSKSAYAATSACSLTSNGQEEKYIATYAVNANNHQQAYAITGLTVFRNIVGSSDKVYLFVYIDPSSTSAISTAGASKTCSTMLSKQTDNIYWDAQDGTVGRNFATVGGDVVMDGGQMLFDQYINPNAHPGQDPVNQQKSASGPSCSVTTSGQDRNSVYMLFVDDSNKQHTFIVTGTSLAQFSVGGVQSTSFYVYLSSKQVGIGTSAGPNSCSETVSQGMPSFEWAVRAPPSGNYLIYGTIGAACPRPDGGQSAANIDQFTDAGYQF
jgi:hypothetical protein